MKGLKGLFDVFSAKSKIAETYSSGCEAFKNEKYDEAEKYFNEVQTLRKDDVNSLLFLASIWWMKGEEDKFIESYRKALELKADSELAWLSAGRLFISQDMFNRALECQANAILHKNDYSEAWNDLGMIYQRKGLTDKANRSISKAVMCNSNNADAWYNLSQVCLDRKEMDKAIVCMKMASKLGDVESQQNLQRLGEKWNSTDEELTRKALSLFKEVSGEISVQEVLKDAGSLKMEELLTTNDIISNLEKQAARNNGKIISSSQKEHFATTVQIMKKIGAERQGSRQEPIPMSRKVWILDVYKLPNGHIIKAGYESF